MEKVLGRVGGCITKGPVLFTPGDEFVLLAKGSEVLIVDGQQATLLGILRGCGEQLPHGQESITSMALHPTVPTQLFTASADGVICLWHWEAGVLLHRLHAGYRIASIACSPITEELFVATQSGLQAGEGETSGETGGRNGKRKNVAGYKSAVVLRLKVNEVKRQNAWRVAMEATGLGTAVMAVSADGKRMAVGRRSGLALWELEADPKRRNVQTVDLGYAPIRLAMHPCEPAVYWTNGAGSVFGTSRVGDAVNRMHWHAHAALSLAVAADGTCLLSGGQEGVIVAWQLGTGGSERHFVPHLGTNVLRLASNHSGSMYAALLRSNTLLLISAASLQVVARYDGLQAGLSKPVGSPPSGVCLVREPRHRGATLLLNGLPGMLQSFDPLHGRGIDHIDVCEQNLVGKGNTRTGLIPANVDVVAISDNGQWMATHDRRATEQPYSQYDQLRFWRRTHDEEGRDTFRAQSSYDAPHGGSPVRHIVFHPDSNQCVTVGEDRKARMWATQGVQVTEGQGGVIQERPVWICRGHLGYRGEPVRAAAYSADGSVLALGIGCVVRLYDPVNLRFLGALAANSGHRGPIGELLVLRDEDYLVATTEDGSIHVWDLRAMALVWALLVPAHGLKMHPDGRSFLVIVRSHLKSPDSLVMHFDPHSATPKACYKHAGLLLAMEVVVDGQILCLLDQTGHLGVLSLSADAPGMRLISDPEGNPYQVRRRKYAGQRATALMNPEERPEVVEGAAGPGGRNVRLASAPPTLPSAPIEKVLLSTIPSHLLPSTCAAFHHYIKYKFPIK